MVFMEAHHRHGGIEETKMSKLAMALRSYQRLACLPQAWPYDVAMARMYASWIIANDYPISFA